MDKETEKKIQQFQLIEQSLDSLLVQRQNIEVQLVENENAIKELKKSDKTPYKIIGTIMISSEKEDLIGELNESKEIFSLRLKTIERQEKNLKDKAEELQKELVEKLK